MARTPILAALIVAAAPPAAAQDACRLCFAAPGQAPGERPLGIEIHADLAFARLALTGRDGGSATIDPQAGTKRTSGELIDLGGMALSGRGVITGPPGRAVRVDLPDRVTMAGTAGGEAELTRFTTDLPAHPVLDASGRLEFSFGAQMVLRGTGGGTYRGRIPISVDYN